MRDCREYECGRCGVRCLVCTPCDRGQRYCPEGCAEEARQESCRAASRRYQGTFQGRVKHAARQRRYRQRLAQQQTSGSAGADRLRRQGRRDARSGSEAIGTAASAGAGSVASLWASEPAARWLACRDVPTATGPLVPVPARSTSGGRQGAVVWDGGDGLQGDREIVTHQGSPGSPGGGRLGWSSVAGESRDGRVVFGGASGQRCSFCGALCGPHARGEPRRRR